MFDEFLHGVIVDVGYAATIEEWINPLVQGVSACVDRRLFEWVAFTCREGFEPQLALSLNVTEEVASMKV
jgi:hypothetical protein